MRGPANSDRLPVRLAAGRIVGLTLASVFALGLPRPSIAQTAINVTLASNDVYRGRSQSADDPAVTLALGFDDPGGFYAGGSVTFAAGDRDLRISSHTQYAGYAWRSGSTSFDLGVIHHHLGDRLDREYASDYVEGYVGLTHGKTSIRAYVSPDYVSGKRVSGYVSVNRQLATVADWTLGGHAGIAFKPRAESGYHTDVDWSLRAGKTLGSFEFGLGIAGSTDNDPRPYDGPLIFAEISRAF